MYLASVKITGYLFTMTMKLQLHIIILNFIYENEKVIEKRKYFFSIFIIYLYYFV